MDNNNSSKPYHVVLFPFMAKGHTIPLLQFARLLLRHRRQISVKKPSISVTIFTTPNNQKFVSDFLSDTSEIKIIPLPFPENIAGIPSGIESTDQLPSISLFVPFTRATKSLQPLFEESLKNLPEVSFIVSDGFLWWTLESANKFKIPRLFFLGINAYASALTTSVTVNKLFMNKPEINEIEPVTVPDFPWIRVKRSDFDRVLVDPSQSDPHTGLLMEQMESMRLSRGFIMNSFYELESTFVDFGRNGGGPKSWAVGPLCLVNPPKPGNIKPDWINWLDRNQEEGCPVLYVAFGTQAEISDKQMTEIAFGLEDSKVNFLWVTRKDVREIIEDLGFAERIKEKGLIVKDWVKQWEILSHKSVKGFMSHCGWNSTQESISVGVPILAWPMMADQPLNAKMVVEELKIGVRIETQDGNVKGFVTRQEITQKVKELMEGENSKTIRKNVEKYAKLAKEALAEETGSSWKNLDLLIEEFDNRTGLKNEYVTKETNGVSK